MCSAFPALLAVVLARNGQLLATLGSAGCQYATAIGSGHSLTETVLVYAATVVGLKCSFHNSMLFCLFVIVLSRRPAFGTGSSVSGCKIRHFFSISQTLVRFSLFLILMQRIFFTTRSSLCGKISNIGKSMWKMEL